LRFTEKGMKIELVARQQGERTPDLRATDTVGCVSSIEAKYIRPPDKLGEYLFRWWQAQKEVAGEIPQGLLPNLKFEWQSVESRKDLSEAESRKDLSAAEIALLDECFSAALLQPSLERHLRSGRIHISYLPDKSLPISPLPLPVQAGYSETEREPLFGKIRKLLSNAGTQLALSQHQGRIAFLLINLSPDISFLWPERFVDRLDLLRQEFQTKGLRIEYEEVGYL
jgi:hypothetical protein